MSEATAKKNVQKLQRIIVDALEDVKAQDVVVFDTEHLSSLFERVIVASGTSNRQTKALSASVRDKVRDAGFPKPRIEGEDNGEWIIVDCGQAVAHIMQPAIRQYYNLEEIWGEKPVRLKHGADKVVAKPAAKKASSAKGSAKSVKSEASGQPAAARKAAAKSAKPKSASTSTKLASTKPTSAKSAGTKPAGAKSAKPKAAPAKKSAASTRAKAAPQAKAAKPRA
jgi:ribosome-associated protein